ncbi:hypothetical protein [Nocardia sp. NPDC003345]
MAVRYSKREQTKLVNRVKKLIDQGNTLNAACTAVSEREGGSPATNTIANWVKAATAEENATPEARPARRRRSRPAAATPEQAPVVPEPAPEPVEPEPATAPAADHEPVHESETAPAPEQEPAAATLIHVRTAGTASDTALDLDDLLDENHRLRTALTEANREIRAMRDLLVVYASR